MVPKFLDDIREELSDKIGSTFASTSDKNTLLNLLFQSEVESVVTQVQSMLPNHTVSAHLLSRVGPQYGVYSIIARPKGGNNERRGARSAVSARSY